MQQSIACTKEKRSYQQNTKSSWCSKEDENADIQIIVRHPISLNIRNQSRDYILSVCAGNNGIALSKEAWALSRLPFYSSPVHIFSLAGATFTVFLSFFIANCFGWNENRHYHQDYQHCLLEFITHVDDDGTRRNMASEEYFIASIGWFFLEGMFRWKTNRVNH